MQEWFLEGFSFSEPLLEARLTLASGLSIDELESKCSKAITITRHKFNVLIDSKKVARFSIYENLASRIVLQLSKLASEQKVSFTIGAGAPAANDFTIELQPCGDKTLMGNLSISGHFDFNNWRSNWLYLHVFEKAKHFELERELVKAQFQAILYRLGQFTECATTIPLLRLSHVISQSAEVGQTSLINHINDSYLIIRNSARFNSPDTFDSLLPKLKNTACRPSKSNPGSPGFKILIDSLKNEFRSGSNTPQSIGVDLPLVLLATLELPAIVKQETDDQTFLFYIEVAKSLSAKGVKKSNDILFASYAGKLANDTFNKAINRMESSGLLEKERDSDQLKIASGIVPYPFPTAMGAPSDAYRTALQIANDSVGVASPSNSGLFTISICISKEDAAILRRRIEEAWQTILMKAEDNTDPHFQIYQIMMQFFSLTKNNEVTDSVRPQQDLQSSNEWCKLVIREMIGMRGFRPDPEWISKRMIPNISTETIKKAIFELKQNGLIRYDAQANRLVQTQKDLKTEDEVDGNAIFDYHRSMLQLTKSIHSKYRSKEQFFAANCVRLSNVKFQALRSILISELREVFNSAGKMQNGNQIYQLNAQVFPLTSNMDSSN